MAYEKDHHYKKSVPFFPDFVLKDSIAITAYLIVFFTIVFFFPNILSEPSGEIPADPFSTPAHIKPEWYFLAAYQELKALPNELLGLALQVIVITILALLPFLDRSKKIGFRDRPVFSGILILSLLGLIGLTIWGAVS